MPPASGAVRPKAKAQMVKESDNRAFHASFGREDQKEGMAAFFEKRKANFRNR